MGTLYIVATPIGNLEDITLRAIRILKEVDMIVCEDTRTTGILLKHYDIKKSLRSYSARASDARHKEIIEALLAGKNIALVSDAGTPAISDPGMKIVRMIREKYPEITISPIPGPSALVTALSASGISAKEFTFLGFIPHKKGRQTMLKRISTEKNVFVFYESSHRILKTLAELDAQGYNREVVVARELTKKFEEIKTGKPTDLATYFKANPIKLNGEFVVITNSKSTFSDRTAKQQRFGR